MKYLLLILLLSSAVHAETVKIKLRHVKASQVSVSMNGQILNVAGSYWNGGTSSGY